MENSMTNFQVTYKFYKVQYTLIIYYYYYQWCYKDYPTTMIYPHYFKPYLEIIVEFINRSMRSSFSSEFMFHQLTTITDHTITVPEVRCHILILLLMMLSSSPASPHSFLYQVPKADLFTTFIPVSRLQIPYQTTVIFFWLCPVVSWCCGNHCWFTFLLWCGYSFVYCTHPQHQPYRSKVLRPFQWY